MSFQSAAQPDTEYTLFGGGVKGKYVSLSPGKEIVQTWACCGDGCIVFLRYGAKTAQTTLDKKYKQVTYLSGLNDAHGSY